MNIEITRYEDNTIRSIKTFRDGIQHGITLHYDKDSEIATVHYFQNDKVNVDEPTIQEEMDTENINEELQSLYKILSMNKDLMTFEEIDKMFEEKKKPFISTKGFLKLLNLSK